MYLKDRFAEFVLAAWDRIMNRITSDAWGRVRGNMVRNIKIKEK